MHTKLTLRIEEKLIAAAKEYSARTGKSVSRVVSDFFEIIGDKKIQKVESIPPVVSSLRGAMKNSGVDEGDYKAYLEEKYLAPTQRESSEG